MNFEFGNVGHYYRINKYWARCVRDGTSPKTSMIYVGAAPNDYPEIRFDIGMPEDSYLPVVSKNGVQGHEASSQNHTIYRRLRVAKEDLNSGAEVFWAIDVCNTYAETGAPAGSWRLPTQRELQAIWILQSEIENRCTNAVPAVPFDLLYDSYYWSGTDAFESYSTASSSYTNAWTVFGGTTPLGGAGNTPHQLKKGEGAYPYRVRCVREQP